MINKLFFQIKRVIYLLLFLISSDKNRSKLIRFFYKCKIGQNVHWTGLPILGTESHLIQIGNNVTIARNVVFHTHDGAVRLLRDKYPEINLYGKINIGNDCFIGSDSIILPNINIGDNSIVGTGSVVTKNIPSNSVFAGNQAKLIKSTDSYKENVLKKINQ
jgi:acetyltransferase-like isoleucine patch superfamily enzyme